MIELKLLRGNLDTIIAKGLEQTADYADKFNADKAHLIVFNRDPVILWDENTWYRHEAYGELLIFG